MAEVKRVLIQGNGAVAGRFFQLLLSTPRFFDAAVAPLLRFGRIPDSSLAKDVITHIHRYGSEELKGIWKVFQEAAGTGDSSAADRLVEDLENESVPAVSEESRRRRPLDLVAGR